VEKNIERENYLPHSVDSVPPFASFKATLAESVSEHCTREKELSILVIVSELVFSFKKMVKPRKNGKFFNCLLKH
jgi:hypothetical protein